jgi:hypothetical protein
MKTIIAVLVVFAALSAHGQKDSTLAQCHDTSRLLLTVKTDTDLHNLQRQMTAGSELVYSTRINRCIALYYPGKLSSGEEILLSTIVYKMDADVISSMFDFIQRHRLDDVCSTMSKNKVSGPCSVAVRRLPEPPMIPTMWSSPFSSISSRNREGALPRTGEEFQSQSVCPQPCTQTNRS